MAATPPLRLHRRDLAAGEGMHPSTWRNLRNLPAAGRRESCIFTTPSNTSIESAMSRYADRLAALRDELARRRLDGFVVPLTDEHMSEYVGAYAQRLAWLTGFPGSAGSAGGVPGGRGGLRHGRHT